MTQMVTRCPKCATAFRITSTQLESAKGAVRCGSCLHIFKAQDFLIKSAGSDAAPQSAPAHPEKTEKPTAASKEPLANTAQQKDQLDTSPIEDLQPSRQLTDHHSPATTAATNAPLADTKEPGNSAPIKQLALDKAKALEDEDDVLISDDMDKVDQKASTYEFDGFMDVDLQPKQTVSLFEREIRYEEPRDDDDSEDADESWAEDLLDDDEETLQQLKKVTPPVEGLKDPARAIDIDTEQTASTIDPSEITKDPKAAYSGPIFSLVSETTDNSHTEEPVSEHEFSEAFLNATRAPESTPLVKESSDFAAALFASETNNGEEEEKPASKRPLKSPKIRGFDTSRAALLMNIMPAPVEFTAKRMRRWYQQKLWPTLSVLMAILLFVQVAYFKFDYFSRVEPARTFFLFTCPFLGCEVPPRIDISEIETTNLIVRNHPKVGEALLVDAILINKAPFEQPFPDLILSFSRLDETPVASRRFTPKDYLGGELAGMKYIPEQQPVHIALEIADPGPEAVNYTLSAH